MNKTHYAVYYVILNGNFKKQTNEKLQGYDIEGNPTSVN